MPDNSQFQNPGKKRRALYAIAPLFLLILCLGTINLLPGWAPTTGAPPVNQTATPVLNVSNQGQWTATVTRLPDVTERAPLTPSPSPTAMVSVTAVVIPTISPGVTIELSGPPANSSFRFDDLLSFYWNWPIPLQEGQRFGVYLISGTEEYLLGVVNEPNLGSGYRLHVFVVDTIESAEPFQWQVRLESALSATSLAESELRSLTLVAGPEPN